MLALSNKNVSKDKVKCDSSICPLIKAVHPARKHNHHMKIFQFCMIFFFTIKLPIPDKRTRSYIRSNCPLFTLYFALYTMHVPSLTEEIRAADDFKLHSAAR